MSEAEYLMKNYGDRGGYSWDKLTCIDVKFIFDSLRLGSSSSANILQIADVVLRVVFLLFLLCF